MFLGLDATDQMLIMKEIAHFKLKLVQGISAIQVERDLNMRLRSISLLM